MHEFHPKGPYSEPYISLDLDSNRISELEPYGIATVEKIDKFPELKGQMGALLSWPWLKRAKYQMVVIIKNNEYVENGFVQIIREQTPFAVGVDEPKIIDYRYWARPMPDRKSLLVKEELNPLTKEILKKLDPVFVSSLR